MSQLALIAVLAIGGFTTALNVTLLSPLLKRVAEEFSVSDATAGQLATLTAASSFVTALVAAPWMDRFSRRAWLRFEAVLLAGGSLLSAVAPSFGLMLAGRVFAGIGGAIIFANCLAAAAETFQDAHQRNRVIGLISTAATLGAVFGLPVITLVADFVGWRWAVGGMVPLSVIVFFGAGTLRGDAPSPGDARHRGWLAGYRQVMTHRETMALLGAMVALFVIWFGWLIYFGAYAETVFAVSATTLSLAFVVGGAVEIVGNNLTPAIMRRRSPRMITIAAAVALAINLFAVGVIYTEEWMIFPFIAVASLCCIFCFLTLSILLLDSMPSAQGAVMSLQSAGVELGGALGVAAAGATLALLDDYEAMFRTLGLVAPIVLIFVVVSTRRPRDEVPMLATPSADFADVGYRDAT